MIYRCGEVRVDPANRLLRHRTGAAARDEDVIEDARALLRDVAQADSAPRPALA